MMIRSQAKWSIAGRWRRKNRIDGTHGQLHGKNVTLDKQGRLRQLAGRRDFHFTQARQSRELGAQEFDLARWVGVGVDDAIEMM